MSNTIRICSRNISYKSIQVIVKTQNILSILLKTALNISRCLPRQPGPGISLESYVYNILYEVMLPQPGKSIRIYLPPSEAHLPALALTLQRPDTRSELPLLDFPLRLLFTYLGVECVIQLLTCVLLENQVLLRSNGKFMAKYMCMYVCKLHFFIFLKFLLISRLPKINDSW